MNLLFYKKKRKLSRISRGSLAPRSFFYKVKFSFEMLAR